jgi:hypothetical protein
VDGYERRTYGYLKAFHGVFHDRAQISAKSSIYTLKISNHKCFRRRLGILQLLGINIFTYFLAAAIAFFLSMNAFLGPGWLGNTIGVQNTGTFTQTSESLPEAVDLSKSEFRF